MEFCGSLPGSGTACWAGTPAGRGPHAPYPQSFCQGQRRLAWQPLLFCRRQLQQASAATVVTCGQPPLQAPSSTGRDARSQSAPPRPPARGGGGSRGGGGRGGGSAPSRGGGPRPPFQGVRGGFSGLRGSPSGSRGGRGGGSRRYTEAPRDGIIANDQIPCEEVRLQGVDKEMLGVMSLMQALDLAEEADTDVVLINPNGVPPVARLVQVSKYKFELAKAAKEASKKQREARQDLKELKLRPSTDVHDYQVRLRAAQKFLAKGDKVKLSLQFRGREIEMQSIGRDLFQKFVDDVGSEAAVASKPEMQGRIMSMILTPIKA